MSLADLKQRLARYRQIQISVVGRKSGRTVTIPVWFVLEDDQLFLVPVHGSDTQWYKNLLKDHSLGVAAREAAAKLQGVPVTKPGEVKAIVEKFRAKYGPGDVKKYYSKLDVAVIVDLSKSSAG
jgi:hypothetical protein